MSEQDPNWVDTYHEALPKHMFSKLRRVIKSDVEKRSSVARGGNRGQHDGWDCYYVRGGRTATLGENEEEDKAFYVQTVKSPSRPLSETFFELTGDEGEETLVVDRQRWENGSLVSDKTLYISTAVCNECPVFIISEDENSRGDVDTCMKTPEELSRFLLASVFFPGVG